MDDTVTIIIPTYARILKETGCLVNLLDSLKKVDDNFRVIILNTTDPPDTSVEELITGFVAKYKEHYPVMTASILDLWKIHEYLENNGFDKIIPRINFAAYSNFRNIGLIIANILRSKLVLMMDDDEIVHKLDFLALARNGLLKKFNKRTILGKTGYYLYHGDYKLKIISGSRKKLWPSVELINLSMKNMIESKERFHETKMALGGIMILAEKLYMRVPFDPYCKRGEDTNYVANCRCFSLGFVFDNQMSVIHKPPRKHVDFYLKFRDDIYRFVYERERLINLYLDPEDLDPYPGFFLRDDLEFRAASVCFYYAKRAFKNGKKKHLKGHMRNMEILFKDAPEYALKYAGKYLQFQKRWKKLMVNIRKSKELSKFFDRF